MYVETLFLKNNKQVVNFVSGLITSLREVLYLRG